jgi:ectoine hydroxylase-related dioxygenase (phytanoyl-CoA dioxygenase family)
MSVRQCLLLLVVFSGTFGQGSLLPLSTAGDYKSAAIKKSNDGDLDGAIDYFRLAVELDPYDSMGMNNLGVALMRRGVEKRSVQELRESYALFLRSLGIKKVKNTKENLLLVVNYLKNLGASVGGEDDGFDDVEEDDDELESEKEKRKKLKQRIKKLCVHDKIRIKVTQKDRKEGILPLKKFKRAIRIMEICGVVVFERLYTRELVKQLRRAQGEVLEQFLEGIEKDVSKTNSTWSEQRSPGRYELVNPLKSPFSDEEFIANGLLQPFMKRMLGSKRLEIDTHSSVTSLPHTPAQHWHRDAGFLFDYDQVQKQIPPHGMVVFMPLVKVSEEMGPTEFLAGSHIQCPSSENVERQLGKWVLQECDHTGEAISTPSSSGSAVVFDLRILHRGLANQTPKKRPLMYMAILKEWFVDHVNFNDKQTASFDVIPPKLKKALGRIDTKEYTLLLEKTLENLGVDVEVMQSNYKFRKHTFE